MPSIVPEARLPQQILQFPLHFRLFPGDDPLARNHHQTPGADRRFQQAETFPQQPARPVAHYRPMIEFLSAYYATTQRFVRRRRHHQHQAGADIFDAVLPNIVEIRFETQFIRFFQ